MMFHRLMKRFSSQSPPPFKFVSSSFIVSSKPTGLGEDALFATETAAGVADGVGGWREIGVDPGEYSRDLMLQCELLSQNSSLSFTAKELFSNAHAKVKPDAFGTTTVCLLNIQNHRQIQAVNLGDSGFFHLRQHSSISTNKKEEQPFTIVSASLVQTCAFNTPYQIGRAPKGMESNLNFSVQHADVYEIPEPQLGDLFVLCTDGFLDNVFESEMLQLVNADWKKNMGSVSTMATTLGNFALKSSKSKTRLSPFALYARKHGYLFEGGKEDDISVVVCMLVDGSKGRSVL